MAGIFGVVSKEDCVKDLFLGTFYLQHRAQDYCGLACSDGKTFSAYDTHRGLMRQQFPKKVLMEAKGNCGIGCVAGDRQPVSVLGKAGAFIVAFDGNMINHDELRDALLMRGVSFSGFIGEGRVHDSAVIAKMIASEITFEKGVESLANIMKGDFAIVALTKSGVYVARGWGKKPLILGRKDGAYAVSSESNSFPNTGFEILRDVEPGEIILMNGEGINQVGKLDLKPVKYDTFEWIYTAHPASVIDGKSVAEVRINLGKALARRYPVEADLVSPVPNSGRWHALGFSLASGIPHIEVFVRYDYSDRSYTPGQQADRDVEARTKLIPIKEMIKDKVIVLVDDSIVRGTQMLNRVRVLKEMGAKEVHARIACPPLMAACPFGKTTMCNEECIARRMPIEEIQEKMGLDSLGYATVEDLEEATGFPREKLCLDCWGV
ncbi:MAG: amidophosphoribosyltransferase [Nanoarchaeota archaeon]|nr:amidophosphoribosyltransferase [Nanoarchaeota archaeon]MBU1104107.1 amidophosphoribosyltransferase [Nanoarchaeota archaeon]